LGETITVPEAIVTVALAGALLPPVPVHVSEYEVFDVSAPVVWLPLMANVPLQPPDAVQDVALVELQVRVEAAPLTTEAGFAVKEAVGSPRIVTVAVAAVLVPPAPLHVNEYVVLVVSAPVDWLPLVAFAPANVPPVAVQDVALVELQVSVEVPPLAIVVGFAVSVAVGTGAMATVADAAVLVPPVPVHVNEYVVLAVKAPVL
jgi:hypothetical protein